MKATATVRCTFCVVLWTWVYFVVVTGLKDVHESSVRHLQNGDSLLDTDVIEETPDDQLLYVNEDTIIRRKRTANRWEAGDERWERATISRPSTSGNQLHRTQRGRNKDINKRCKVKVTEVEELVKASIASTVADALRQELEPLHTALRIVKLDTFSEGIVRQLNTLEHIQSKLLTEYGEMREAVSQSSRTVQDLAQQIASLDAKVEILSKGLDSTSSTPPDTVSTGPSSTGSSTSSSSTRAEELKAVLMQASAAFSVRLSATERRVKEDLTVLETKMTEAIKRSQMLFDARLSSLNTDTNRLLNRTCPGSDDEPHSSNSVLSSNKLFSLDNSPQQAFRNPFTTGSSMSFSPATHQGFPSLSTLKRQREPRARELHSSQATESSEQSGTAGQFFSHTRSEGVSPILPSIVKSDIFSFAAISRLASEIASQLTQDPPKDCSEIAVRGETTSGVYTIHPVTCSSRTSIKVWCDMDTDGGGWTVLQRRGTKDGAGRDDFFKEWMEYKWGFGDPESDYWLGNEHIHQLTSSGDYDLRVDVKDWSDEERWAQYRHFYVTDELSNYTLHLGDYRGTAGNSLRYHDGAPFSTKDRDNDGNPMSHCARTFHGAWWFTSCHESHLNGRYHRSPHRAYGDGINWMTFRGLNYSHKFSRMMLRPSSSAPTASPTVNTQQEQAVVT